MNNSPFSKNPAYLFSSLKRGLRIVSFDFKYITTYETYQVLMKQ